MKEDKEIFNENYLGMVNAVSARVSKREREQQRERGEREEEKEREI